MNSDFLPPTFCLKLTGVIQRDVEAVQAHVLLPGVPLALDVKGGVPVVDVVQLVILLGHVFQLLGLGWFSGRAGAIGELDKLFLGDIRVGGDEGGHWVLVCVGLGVLVGELTHDRVCHLLRLIGGSGGRGEGAEDWRKEAGSYETEEAGASYGGGRAGAGLGS